MESKLHVQERDVVVPGMVLASGMDYLPSRGTYRKDDKILANRLGLVEFDGKVIRTIPLAGKYLPKKDDIVIGRVIDILLNGWRLNINSAYDSVLTMKEATSEFIQRGADLTRYFALTEWVVCQVVAVTSQNLIDVSMRGPGLRKLIGGRILTVNTYKVPRIIGKRGSMVSMIKRATDVNIVVGQNGRIWLNGTPQMELIAISAIEMIAANAHKSGLTEQVKNYLESATGRTVDPSVEEPQEDRAPSDGGGERREFRSPRPAPFRRGGHRGGQRDNRPPRNNDYKPSEAQP